MTFDSQSPGKHRTVMYIPHKALMNSCTSVKMLYSLSCSKLPTISTAVMRVVAHRVGKSRVLEKVSA